MKQIRELLPALAQRPKSATREQCSNLPATRSDRPTRGTEPASEKAMSVCLGQLVSVYGVPAGWEQGQYVYRRLWGALPADVLQDAINQHMATPKVGDWFPKPSQILALAETEMRDRRADQERADSLALPKPELIELSEEDRAHIETGFATLRQEMRQYAEETRPRPAPAYVTDAVDVAPSPWSNAWRKKTGLS